jgi:predicted unusual protein kinase regulating ubiquinone biosynthesis (AarF/ABC1/UbiB family)
MKLSPRYLRRYKDIAFLGLKYGRRGLLSQFRLDDDLDVGSRRAEREASNLPDDLERMGPTFVKLGQLLSSRPDLLPERHRAMLSRLQDKVHPFPYDQVESTIEKELGTRISHAFSSFERVPVAAASLGQVHRAVLRDGRPVVVKVQRPNIRRQLGEDFAAMEQLAKFLHRYTQFG